MVKIFLHFLKYVLESSSLYMTLHPIPTEFDYIHIRKKFCFLFYQCASHSLPGFVLTIVEAFAVYVKFLLLLTLLAI
jgi:hypothetical protein